MKRKREITLSLDVDLLLDLDLLAAKQRRSRSNMANIILDAGVVSYKKVVKRKSKRQDKKVAGSK